MKPKWKDAPKWAKYLAMDGNGKWKWYENIPKPVYVYNGGIWDINSGKWELAANTEKPIWDETLEKRPI